MSSIRGGRFLVFIIGFVQSAEEQPWHGQINTMDLVIINGTNEDDGKIYPDEIGLRLQKFREDVEMTNVAISGDGERCNIFSVPEKFVRKFVIGPSPHGNYILSDVNRKEIRATVTRVLEGRFKSTSILDMWVCFGQISFKHGLNGLYFAFNLLLYEETDKFHDFRETLRAEGVKLHQADAYLNFFFDKHVKFGRAPFSNARGYDLVRIRQLKDQNDTELHRKAQHLSKSYGRVMRNVNPRINSRDQMEYPIQSLSDPKIKLALKRKYLRRICNIFMHKVNEYPFDEYPYQVSELLLSNKNDSTLLLPYFIRNDTIVTPIKGYSYLVFLLRSQGLHSSNFIRDIGMESLLMFDIDPIGVENWLESLFHLPLDIGKEIWDKATDEMKKTMRPDDRQRDKALLKLNKELFNRHYDVMMKLSSGKFCDDSEGERRINECKQRMKREIGKSILRNSRFYHRLYDCIRRTLLEKMYEQDPRYAQLYVRKDTNVYTALVKLYILSIAENYLAANARGHHLHVVYFGCSALEFLMNIKSDLSGRLAKVWNIASFDLAETLMDEILIHVDH